MHDSDLIRFLCPHCQKRVKVKPELAGRHFPCPNPSCGQPIFVPLAINPGQASLQSRGYEVFVSYSNKDKQWAEDACAALERHKLACWMAPRDIVPGAEWGAAIIHGIDACKIMVLVLSAHANDSPQVRREVERAINKGLTIVPLRVEDVKPAGALEYALSNTHWLDAFRPPVEPQLQRLAQAVEALLAGTSATVAGAATALKPRRKRARMFLGGAGFLACALVLFTGYQRFLRYDPPQNSPNQLVEGTKVAADGGSKDKDNPNGQPKPAQPQEKTTLDGVEYVVDKVFRNGNEVTMQVLGTNSRDDRIVTFRCVEAVDADGYIYNEGTRGIRDEQGYPLSINLREGVKTRFEVTLLKVRAETTEFKRVDIVYMAGRQGTFGAAKESSDKVITFKNVKVSLFAGSPKKG